MTSEDFKHGIFGTAVTAAADAKSNALIRYPDGKGEEVNLRELFDKSLKSRGF